MKLDRLTPEGQLTSYPPAEKWEDWVEYDPKCWPERVKRHYTIIPTICFNCEAACGLLAYLDKETLEVRKFEGNPYHPGSRGRNCAKGPATINQVNDPERILYPLKRSGSRGDGQWERVTWEQALDDIGSRIRTAILEGRRNEIMYHVGRPGHERHMERVLQAWGVDGHNSHTNICSASARLGYALWLGDDRPSPDHANAQFILLLSAHLESGHFFNPHAQRIIESRFNGAKIAVMDPRLSNTASVADYWMPTWPGSEPAVLLTMARLLLEEDLFDKDFVQNWTNWRSWMATEQDSPHATFEEFITALKQHYAAFTPQFAEQESGVPAKDIIDVARQIGRAGNRFASHVWRGAASGNLGGWQTARSLTLLTVLTGSVGTKGGTLPHAWNKFRPTFWSEPPQHKEWNELLFPTEYPLSHYEMGFLLPHFLNEGRGKLDVYFTRVFNPVWTNPDGHAWIEALTDTNKIGLHVALTPTWNESAYYADYVLPMGLAGERHDVQSQDTHSGKWLSFRQPVARVAMEMQGKSVERTYEANPGEVWEEDEFWIDLSWRIDPDGEMGIRRYFESPYRDGDKLTVKDYYQHMFETSVDGLPEKASQEGLSPYEYMQKYGAFQIEGDAYELYRRKVSLTDTITTSDGTVIKDGKPIGLMVDGKPCEGFSTPSRRLEIYSPTLEEWHWPEYRLPGYIRSHVHRSQINTKLSEFVLVPTFRLPTQIHTRSANAKWLNEISHRNPVWMNQKDASQIGVNSGDLLRITTEIGHFVNKVWVTESIMPGVIACSHHLGRWRLKTNEGSRWSSTLVEFIETDRGTLLRHVKAISPFSSTDPDSSRIWWSDGGVHQNLCFPVQPDPVSGMNCWHQKVTVEKARNEDKYGDVLVNRNRAREVYRKWLTMTRPSTGSLRRPLWLARPVKPVRELFNLPPPK